MPPTSSRLPSSRPRGRAAARRRAARGRGAVGAADRAPVRAPRHARLPGAARDERGARRPVRQPDQPQAARGEGLHLRRAHRLRLAARAGAVLDAGQRAHGGDRRRDSRLARRARGDPRRAAGHRQRAGAGEGVADPRLPAQLRDGAAGGPRRGAARALRSAGHLLRGVRAAHQRRDGRRRHARRRRATSIRPGSRRSSSATMRPSTSRCGRSISARLSCCRRIPCKRHEPSRRRPPSKESERPVATSDYDVDRMPTAALAAPPALRC